MPHTFTGRETPGRAALSRLVERWEQSGRSQNAFARDVLARDADNLRDWLGGRPMPRQLNDWIQRVADIQFYPHGLPAGRRALAGELVVCIVRPRTMQREARFRRTAVPKRCSEKSAQEKALEMAIYGDVR